MVFLSYSSQNRRIVRRLLEALATEGLPCWIDEQQLDAGARLRASLLTSIAEANIYVYVSSDAASQSKWVQEELEHAVGLESGGTLEIIPLSLPGCDDALPKNLSGRVVARVDGTPASFSRFANHLSRKQRAHELKGHCRLSATVRLTRDRLLHTLKQAREFSETCDLRVSFLDNDHDSLEELYWDVADVQFPNTGEMSVELTETVVEIIAEMHRRSRSIVKEIHAICNRYAKTEVSDEHKSYCDAGNERILRILLHRLQWDIAYLRAIRDGRGLDKEFVDSKNLPPVVDGHRCDFVSDSRKLGSATVPGHANPYYPTVKEPVPWGLTSPFSDMVPSEVGTAVGEIVARRFINQSLSSTEMPSAESLMYGLS